MSAEACASTMLTLAKAVTCLVVCCWPGAATPLSPSDHQPAGQVLSENLAAPNVALPAQESTSATFAPHFAAPGRDGRHLYTIDGRANRQSETRSGGVLGSLSSDLTFDASDRVRRFEFWGLKRGKPTSGSIGLDGDDNITRFPMPGCAGRG